MAKHYDDQTREDYSKFLKMLGEYIRTERKKAGYKSANTFAHIIDIAESQYREYERGETDMQLSALMKIFNGLGKSLNDFLKIATNNSNNSGSAIVFMGALELENQVRNQVKAKSGVEIERSLDSEDVERIIKILSKCVIPAKKSEIIKALGLSFKTEKLTRLFNLLQQNTWLAMQYPDNPNRPNQGYYTTEQGKKVLGFGKK